MLRLLLTLMLLFSLTGASAQEFNTPWIGAPQPDSTSHVYFRQTYLLPSPPAEASLTVTTTGLVKVYVNECNVGTASFYPYREGADAAPRSVTLDVTPYLRSDTNVVAVLYSPSFPHKEGRQVAVTFFGRDGRDEPFACYSDSDWLCRPAPSGLLPGGGEWIDGQRYTPDWKSAGYSPALWQGAVSSSLPSRRSSAGSIAASASVRSMGGNAGLGWRLGHIRGKQYFDLVADSVQYEFGTGFFGQLRLTIREARAGECIHFGRNIYYCSGQMDEQACPVFGLDTYRRVLVYGDRHFRQSQIVDIEALEMQPQLTAY